MLRLALMAKIGVRPDNDHYNHLSPPNTDAQPLQISPSVAPLNPSPSHQSTAPLGPPPGLPPLSSSRTQPPVAPPMTATITAVNDEGDDDGVYL